MFFRNAYSGQSHNPDGPRTIEDSILGNIGEPLRVGDDDEDDDGDEDNLDIEEGIELR